MYERQRNHSIIYFCLLSAVHNRHFNVYIVKAKAKAKQLWRVMPVASKGARIKQMTTSENYFLEFKSLFMVIAVNISFALCTLCSSTYRNDGSRVCACICVSISLFSFSKFLYFSLVFSFSFSFPFLFFWIFLYTATKIVPSYTLTAITITILVTIYSSNMYLCAKCVMGLIFISIEQVDVLHHCWRKFQLVTQAKLMPTHIYICYLQQFKRQNSNFGRHNFL